MEGGRISGYHEVAEPDQRRELPEGIFTARIDQAPFGPSQNFAVPLLLAWTAEQEKPNPGFLLQVLDKLQISSHRPGFVGKYPARPGVQPDHHIPFFQAGLPGEPLGKSCFFRTREEDIILFLIFDLGDFENQLRVGLPVLMKF